MSTATVNELETGTFFSRLVRWISKGGLAILDQGLISGSNFLVSILLARWLTADQYGAYAVAFGIYLMLTLVYQSLMLEPMGVFSGTTFGENLRGYVRTLVSIHVVLSATIFSALLISWAISHRVSSGSEVTAALAGIAFASPCLMLFALSRRCFYIELSPAPAAAGAFIYSSVVLAGLYVVYHRALLSPFTAFLLLGSGALITGIVLMIGAGSKLSGAGDAPEVRETWGRHWRYGRWALAGTIAGWLPSYIYFPLLSSFTSMAASGQLKALMNLTLPFEQMKGALVMLALPYAARVAGQGGKAGARILGTRLTWASAAGAIMYWAVIIPLYKPIFHLLYSNRYLDVAYLLPALALGQIFWSATFGPSLALRAMESPASVFAALGIATVASLMVGVPATWLFGLKGAIWGSNAADVFSFIALWWALKRKLSAADDAALSSKWFGTKAPVSSVPVEVSEEA